MPGRDRWCWPWFPCMAHSAYGHAHACQIGGGAGTPAVVLKFDSNVMHHGRLGFIRSGMNQRAGLRRPRGTVSSRCQFPVPGVGQALIAQPAVP